MARRIFFSFQYEPDIFRVNQIRKCNTFETTNDFHDHASHEKVMRESDEAIKRLIENQLKGASVTCVLIGEDTYNSDWVKYEIRRSFELNMGIFAIHIHDLKSIDSKTSAKGRNPLSHWNYKGNSFTNIFKTYNPSDFINASKMMSTKEVTAYDIITDNIGNWAEEAAKQAGR